MPNALQPFHGALRFIGSEPSYPLGYFAARYFSPSMALKGQPTERARKVGTYNCLNRKSPGKSAETRKS